MQRSNLAQMFLFVALTFTVNVHADCWRLPTGEVRVIDNKSVAPPPGALRIQCPPPQPSQQEQQRQQQAAQQLQQEQQQKQQAAQQQAQQQAQQLAQQRAQEEQLRQQQAQIRLQQAQQQLQQREQEQLQRQQLILQDQQQKQQAAQQQAQQLAQQRAQQEQQRQQQSAQQAQQEQQQKQQAAQLSAASAGVERTKITVCGAAIKASLSHENLINIGVRGVTSAWEVGASYMGISFDPACDAHDACYVSKDTRFRKSCDDTFKNDATVICEGLGLGKKSKEFCFQSRDAAYSAIRQFGGGAWCQAKGKLPCPP